MSAGIIAVGHHVPADTIITNHEIAEWTGVEPDRILARTGITERRYANPDTPTSQLAVAAVRDLLDRHPDALENTGALMVVTSTPDQPQPPTALFVARDLGLPPNISVQDINSVCTGFLTALAGAAGVVDMTGRRALVVAADKYSGIIDRTDWRTAALFGDGAGAAVVDRVPAGYGIVTSSFRADAEFVDFVGVAGGGSREPLTAESLAAGRDRFRMQGRKVRDYAITHLPTVIWDVLTANELKVSDINRWVAHQANPILLSEIADQLGIDPSRVPMTAPLYGNSGAASIAVTLAEAHAQSPFERGDRIVLAAIGGGMTVGAMLVVWY